MPSYTRGKKRDKLTGVKIDNTQQIFYLFNTKDLSAVGGVTQSDIQALGHFPINQLPTGSIAFLRANSPKPPRVSKKLSSAKDAQGTVGTFCAVDKLRDALSGGWNLAKPGRKISLSGTNKSVIALAEISTGGYYAFSMNEADFTANKAALGLKSKAEVNTDIERAKVFRGASLPRPGKAKTVITSGTNAGSTFSSFYSHDAQLTGFEPVSVEVLL